MIQDIFPHKLNNHFRPGQVPADTDTAFLFSGENVLCRVTEDGIVFPRVGEIADPDECAVQEKQACAVQEKQACAAQEKRAVFVEDAEAFTGRNEGEKPGAAKVGDDLIYLFDVDGERYFLGDGESVCLPAGYDFVPLRGLRKKDVPDKHLIFAAITARHLRDWYRTARYCGCCGTPLRPSETERAMVCPSCGQVFYPRINPAVIVGVTHGDHLLLTRYAGRRLSSYALVAGFTEIGETLEETVAREVMEETGLTVTNIRYYKSQPWGYAADILAGYYCDVVGDPTIRMDADELKEAVWMARADIPGQADDFSLTNEMMCAFRDGLM